VTQKIPIIDWAALNRLASDERRRKSNAEVSTCELNRKALREPSALPKQREATAVLLEARRRNRRDDPPAAL
jgi:hypothetical protein